MITGLNMHIRVGGIEFHRVPEFRMISQRHHPLTRVTVTVPDPTGRIFRTINDMDPVTVIWGYRNQVPARWQGTVKGVSVDRNKDQLRVNSVGLERPLAETVIKQSFINETPEAIVRYAVSQAGLSVGRIESTGVTFPRFVTSSIPVWQVARQCEHTLKKAFGLDMRPWSMWMGKDSRINWGPFDEDAGLPVIDSNANLIRHSPGRCVSELNRVETFMLPRMAHSMQFHLNDLKRNISESYRAIKVEHVWEDSKARTFISYGDEYERY
ncbi:MAG: hypothetical protein MI862_26715 [Desulfobacterales bacterium]|nr:hypothetical protein [Desulfobacterales bacterium]